MMGMFDNIIIECDLPCKVPDLDKAEWQTKDTPAQYLDIYYLTKDGRLEHEHYDPRVEYDDEAPLGFYLHRDNPHRVFCEEFTGAIHFYANLMNGWYRFCALIKAGRVIEIVLIEEPK